MQQGPVCNTFCRHLVQIYIKKHKEVSMMYKIQRCGYTDAWAVVGSRANP